MKITLNEYGKLYEQEVQSTKCCDMTDEEIESFIKDVKTTLRKKKCSLYYAKAILDRIIFEMMYKDEM